MKSLERLQQTIKEISVAVKSHLPTLEDMIKPPALSVWLREKTNIPGRELLANTAHFVKLSPLIPYYPLAIALSEMNEYADKPYHSNQGRKPWRHPNGEICLDKVSNFMFPKVLVAMGVIIPSMFVAAVSQEIHNLPSLSMGEAVLGVYIAEGALINIAATASARHAYAAHHAYDNSRTVEV